MTVAPRLACSAGSARLTTLPSIKARLDPRIVAARIHGAASDEHGAAAGGERMTPPSHGCAIEVFIYLSPWRRKSALSPAQPGTLSMPQLRAERRQLER